MSEETQWALSIAASQGLDEARAFLAMQADLNSENKRLHEQIESLRAERDELRETLEANEPLYEEARKQLDGAVALLNESRARVAELEELLREIRSVEDDGYGAVVLYLPWLEEHVDPVLERGTAPRSHGRPDEFWQAAADLIVELGDCDLTKDASDAATALLHLVDGKETGRATPAWERVRELLIEEFDEAWDGEDLRYACTQGLNQLHTRAKGGPEMFRKFVLGARDLHTGGSDERG